RKRAHRAPPPGFPVRSQGRVRVVPDTGPGRRRSRWVAWPSSRARRPARRRRRSGPGWCAFRKDFASGGRARAGGGHWECPGSFSGSRQVGPGYRCRAPKVTMGGMAEQQSTTTGPQAAPERPRLVRVPEGLLVAGVCTGLGRYLGVDPVVLRVGFAVLLLA